MELGPERAMSSMRFTRDRGVEDEQLALVEPEDRVDSADNLLISSTSNLCIPATK
jgi:hypothetical protein